MVVDCPCWVSSDSKLGMCPSHLSMVPWLTGEGMGSSVIANCHLLELGVEGCLLIFLNKEVMATAALFSG